MFLFFHVVGFLCLTLGMGVSRMALPPVVAKSLANNADEVEQEQILLDADNHATPSATMSAMDEIEDIELDENTPASTPGDFELTTEDTSDETSEAEIEKPVRISKRIKFHKLEKVVHITPGSPLKSQLQPPKNWEKSWSDFLSRSEALRHTRKFVIGLQKDEQDNDEWE
ncbi:hypothetical protein KR026_009134 [Drosophila bipectinata]|nr:hypothetical protein KR026_009134 [Drosophila bipectinata]